MILCLIKLITYLKRMYCLYQGEVKHTRVLYETITTRYSSVSVMQTPVNNYFVGNHYY